MADVIDDNATSTPSSTVDRRAALKKAALAAGVVAWTTPVVQVLSTGTAHAQGVTACSPVLKVSLLETGSGCACVPSWQRPRWQAAAAVTLYSPNSPRVRADQRAPAPPSWATLPSRE